MINDIYLCHDEQPPCCTNYIILTCPIIFSTYKYKMGTKKKHIYLTIIIRTC